MTIRLLLVHANSAFLKAASDFLGTQAAVVIVAAAHDGQDGLVKAASLQPALVLIDISIPLTNGLEVAHRLQSLP